MTEDNTRSIGGIIAAGKGMLRDRRERQAEADLQRSAEARKALAADARAKREAGESVYFRTVLLAGDADATVSMEIATIELQGWRLETTGYTYVPESGWTSRMGDSSDTTFRGRVQGHFIFRPSGTAQRPLGH